LDGTRHRFLVGFMRNLIDERALSEMAALVLDADAKAASVALKDVPAGMFSLLYLVQNPHILADVKSGKELFDIISQHELEFSLIKNPRESISHEPRS
jgi:hypothetical protein